MASVAELKEKHASATAARAPPPAPGDPPRHGRGEILQVAGEGAGELQPDGSGLLPHAAGP